MTIAEFINKVGFKVNKSDVKKVNDSITDIKSTATKLLGALGIGFSLTQMNQMVEEFGRVNNQIRSSTEALGDQQEIQEQILASATKTRTSFGDTAKVVSNLVKENKTLFGNVEEAVKFNDAATMLFKTAGKTNEEIAGLMEAINKSFAKGKVDTETINQLLERSPEAIELLNNKLGTTSDQLEEMVSEGKISVQDLKDVFVDNAEEIEKNFQNIPMTISDALLIIRNKWGFWLSDMDETLGLTKTISKIMVNGFEKIMAVLNRVRDGFQWLSEKVGGTEKLLKLLAVVGGSLFAAFQFSKITSGLGAISKILGGISGKTMAVAAVFIILALIIEDLINFMQGNDSMIGEMLNKSGTDAEAFRQTISDLWEQIKGLIPVFKEFAMTIGKELLGAFMAVLPSIIELAINLIPIIVDVLQQVIGLATSLIKSVLPLILSLIQKILPLIVKVISSVLPAVVALIGEIIPLLVQLVESILPLIVDLVNSLLPLITTIVTTVLPYILQLIQTIVPILVQIVTSILPVIITLVSTVIPLLIQIIEAILPVIIELINQFLPLVIMLVESILPIILELIEMIVPILIQIIEAILPVVVELLTAILPILTPIIELAANLVAAILPVLVELLSAILPILQPILAILEPIASVLGVIINAISRVVGWLASGLGSIIELIFGTKIDTSAAKKVNAYADGTESTSDTFIAGEEGPELITGAPGRKVFTALETGNIFRAMELLARTAVAQPTTVTNSSNSRVVNQYNEFVNTFHGEQAVQQNAERTINRATGDATAELARGLAFAR